MISVLILVCELDSGQCFNITEPLMFFPDNEACVDYTNNLIEIQKLRVVTGELLPFIAEFQCISWEKA